MLLIEISEVPQQKQISVNNPPKYIKALIQNQKNQTKIQIQTLLGAMFKKADEHYIWLMRQLKLGCQIKECLASDIHDTRLHSAKTVKLQNNIFFI
jgi:hypothetical protein